ncbi:hypothetical protein CesoFtcFv8_022516 [Champsocephalus esox]|uniref:Uncharacterized protein n=1 Tax=Champsocephalus esox TaxID=159716 RepID=A0AAN8GLI8_9TELE|nr:hypothetical protein CesoFtcFv8_022516 [Champsocephalus esox]
MSALEAVRLLRGCCLRPTPGEAPTLARPPTPTPPHTSQHVHMTPTAQSQNQWCQSTPAADVFRFLCLFGLHSEELAGLPWRAE